VAEQTLRIGFVGAGGIVRQRHAPGLAKVEGVEFAAVANRRPESTAAAAEAYGIRKTFDDWRELVNWDGIDVVWIGTHPNLHRPVTEAALAAGKHVFCQARMATSYADAKAMYEAARRSERTTMLCPPPHYMRGDRVVRRLLREGLIGQPYNVLISSFSDAYHDPTTPLHWRQVVSLSGYNTLDLGMMIEVQQRWLGYARRVTALDHTFTPTRPDSTYSSGRVDRPDTVSAVAELESGALLTLVVSGVARHAADANAIQTFGSEGTLRYLAAGDRILVGRAGDAELQQVPIRPEEERRWTVEEEFIAAVRAGRRSAEPTFWDGLKYMEMTEAIFRSADTGQAVELPFERLNPPASQ
jgi:predicted dehydrogenase